MIGVSCICELHCIKYLMLAIKFFQKNKAHLFLLVCFCCDLRKLIEKGKPLFLVCFRSLSLWYFLWFKIWESVSNGRSLSGTKASHPHNIGNNIKLMDTALRTNLPQVGYTSLVCISFNLCHKVRKLPINWKTTK